MGLSDIAKAQANSIMGITAKAYLEVALKRIASNSASPQSSGSSLVAKAKSGLEKAASGYNGSLDLANANSNIMLQVRFNPAKISFSTSTVAMPNKMLNSSAATDFGQQFIAKASTSMRVQLVFDDVNPKEAFMMDKANIGSSLDIARSVTALASTGGDMTYTVMPQTNALLAMLMHSSIQRVIFHWNNLSFDGVVSQLSAKYTMFSPKGHPIRSVVDLDIMQQIVENTEIKYWEAALDKCFGAKDAQGEEYGFNGGDIVSNILNH